MAHRQAYLAAAQKTLEQNIFYHSLALEACMAGIYGYLESQKTLKSDAPAKEDWLIAGLVHDIDYSGATKSDHPLKTKEVLSALGLEISQDIDSIVKAHAPSITGVKPQNQAQWAIFCADSLTGLIVAVALVYPTRKLADVKLSSVLKRFHKEPRFAAGTRRNEVAQCQNPDGLNISIDKFIEICLNSIKQIAPSIGL